MTQLRQNSAGVLCQDSVVANDLFGEFIQGCGVHRYPGATAGRTEGHAHAFPTCDRLNGFVDEGISLGLIRNFVRQFPKVAAADRFAFAGTQEHFCFNPGDPALRQGPGTGHAFTDVGWFDTGRAKELPQGSGEGIGEYRTIGLVGGGCDVDALVQHGDFGVGGTIDGGHPQLGGQVHEQLVAAGGDATGEDFGGVAAGDLVDADLVLEGEQHVDGIGGGEGKFWCWAGGCCRSSWCRGRGLGSGCRWGGRSRCRCGRCGFFGCGFFFGFLEDRRLGDVVQHDHVLVAFHVEHWHVYAQNIHAA